jgi:hypothetical protein
VIAAVVVSLFTGQAGSPPYEDLMELSSLNPDLENKGDVEGVHPFARALNGELPGKALAGPLPEEEELDSAPESRTDLKSVPQRVLVVDADASQQMCLEAAARGHSFVIDGAPGTGKTQTIVNLLAGGLNQGTRILLVSDSEAALDRVSRRLDQVGLGDYCLGLYGPRKAAGTVLTELSRCVRERLPAGSPADDSSKVKECRDHLNAYVEAVHAVREPLQRSIWSALEELVSLGELPSVDLGLVLSRSEPGLPDNVVVVTEVTASWLAEVSHALERMRQLWHIGGQMRFPWRGFKAERFTKQVREEVSGLVERVRTRLDRLLAAAEQYGVQIGCTGSLALLMKAAELLEANPGHVAAGWFKSGDAPQLGADLEHCADEYQRLGHARAPLTARYGPSLWQLPEGTAVNVDRAWRAAAPLLPPGDERGAGLLSRQQQLRGWAADTQKRIPGWLAEAKTLEKWLAVALPRGAAAEADESKADPAPAALRRLQRLANLCMSETPPERAWVHDAKALDEARSLIAAGRPVFADYHRRRQKLLETYKESFFELDLERMGGSFAGPYKSWLRLFNGQFRRDRRALRRRSRAEVVPATMADDVLAGRALLADKARLEAEQPARKAVLGRYEKGLDTSFEAAERASRVAVEASDLVHKLGYSALPARFVDVLCADTPAPEKIRAAAKRLHDSLGAWQHATQELKAFLPMESLPGTKQPLEESALSALNLFARDLQASLNQFATVTDPVLAHAVAPPPDAASLVADLHQAEEVLAWEASHETEGPRWQERLGPAFQGLASDFGALRKAVAWVRRAHDLFQGAPPERFIQLACGPVGKLPSPRDLRTALEQYTQALHGLEVRFDAPGPMVDGQRLADLPPEAVKQHLTLLRDRSGDLADWIDWRNLPTRFDHLGLGVFWQEIRQNPPPLEQLAGVFTKSFLTAWLEALFAQDPVLERFQWQEHERLIAEFRERDRAGLISQRLQVVQRVEEKRPAPGDAECVQALEEAARSSQDLPAVLETLCSFLPRLKPCLLVDTAAADYLPADLRFDMIIFHEAGLTPLEDALPVIDRGRQIIVVGDRQQTSASVDEEPASESLLQACVNADLPCLTLRCHYTSRCDSLITFANHHFYGSRLTTYPAPYLKHPEYGVELEHVSTGIYQDGQNAAEASRVADLVIAHYRANPHTSLGVIVCQDSQQTAISDELERRLPEEPGLESLFQSGAEAFFVKSLTAARGERRDAIIWSVGYGRDARQRLPDALPPLDQEAGSHVLNVAITRARKKLIVVSSLRAVDLDPGIATAEGLVLLRQFLQYAESGPAADVHAVSLTEPGPLEDDIVGVLEERGYTSLLQVGCGLRRLDIGVLDPEIPGRFLLGIELDGPPYRSDPTATQRDCLRHEILESLGWHLHRIWGLDWVFHRQEAITRLCEAVDNARRRSQRTST